VILVVIQMIVEPEQRVPDFIKAGADIVSVHCENASTIHLHRTVNQVCVLGSFNFQVIFRIFGLRSCILEKKMESSTCSHSYYWVNILDDAVLGEK
jgi:hypothetical protein